MQKIIGLVGYVNKSEFVINLAKVLALTGKTVLVIDATAEERLRYTIPGFNTSKSEYLSHFDGVDYAMGFKSIDNIKEYVYKKTSNAENYDYILLDIDNVKAYEGYRGENLAKTFFFMEYRNMSLAKNIELLNTIVSYEPVERKAVLTKVLFRDYVTRASEMYFESKIQEFPIEWAESVYDLQYTDQDRIADIEGEQSGYLDINRHTKQFVITIADMASDIIGDMNSAEIKKIIKTYVRGRK